MRASTIRTVGEWWNGLAPGLGLPTIDNVRAGSAREKHVLARARDLVDDHGYLAKGLDVLGAKIRSSAFLTGRSNGRANGQRPFRATFDWVMNASNYEKIMEGNYENGQRARH